MFERLTPSLLLSAVFTVTSSFSAFAADVASPEGDETYLKYGDTVGDFYHTDPNFSSTARNLRYQAVAVRATWRGWHTWQLMSLFREIQKHSPDTFKQRELACRFSFSVTDKKQVRDVKILEPSADADFNRVVELGIKSLDPKTLKFPAGTKERLVLVNGTYTSKPTMHLDVTTKKGISLVKKESK